MVQIFAYPSEKPVSSIVQTLILRGVKNPEKVDAVGLQPTASIPFLQYVLSVTYRCRTRPGPRRLGRRFCAVQAFCRRQNLGAGAIHLPRACSISEGWRRPWPPEPKRERCRITICSAPLFYVDEEGHKPQFVENGYKKAEKGRTKTDPRGKIGVKCGNNSVF